MRFPWLIVVGIFIFIIIFWGGAGWGGGESKFVNCAIQSGSEKHISKPKNLASQQ